MNDLYIKVDKLIDHWGNWETCNNYYLRELLPELKKDFSKADETEKNLLTEIKKIATKKEWGNLEKIIEKRSQNKLKKEKILEKIKECLYDDDFDAAERIFNEYPGAIHYDEFEKIVEAHINKTTKQIEDELKKHNYKRADVLYKNIRKFYPIEKYQKLEESYRRKEIKCQIKDALERYNFKKAEDLYRNIKKIYPLKKYQELKKHYQDKKTNEIRNQIEEKLQEYKFKEADILYKKVKDTYPLNDYKQLKERYFKEKNKKEILKKLKVCLESNDFIGADELFFTNQYSFKDEYEDLKSEYIKKYLNENLIEKTRISIDKEKALAISKTDKNLLLTARAGSGKTTTIAYKTFFLVNKENISPDDIMILAFNKKAAEEIKDRITKKFELTSFTNARTFHSLAYQIVQPKEELIFDEKGEFSRKELSQYVQKLIRANWNIDFKLALYLFFRKEGKEIEKYRLELSAEDYYLYKRNFRQVTLRGKTVKSDGEKYIADFLFEHNIPYKYEKIFRWNDRNYKPDFTIWPNPKYKKFCFILEHWGIYIKGINSGQSIHDPEKYRDQIKRKKEFWRNKKMILIETSLDDLIGGRENFENILMAKLEELRKRLKEKYNFDIGSPKKLSKQEIIAKITEQQGILRITEMFVQFIQKAKQAEMTPADIEKIINSAQNNLNGRTKIFLELANKVYKKYEEALKKDSKIDFYDLLMKAIKIIDESKGECEIPITNEKSVKLNNLKWILIDEYQDFSELFYDLIATIKKYNKNVRLFCVGDDWQAINGFAGSDLKFFTDFDDFIEDSSVADLLTNYRSKKEIVENSNKLMTGLGKSSTWREDGGAVEIIDVANVTINYKKDTQQYPDKKFIFFDSEGKVDDNCFIKARYLKKCYEIIQKNLGKDIKDIAILNRTNQIYNTDFKTFYFKLKRCFTKEELEQIGDFNRKIKIATAHGFKGLEAEVVIILRVCNGSFPLIHPDNQLFEIFGQTVKDVLDEEKRLFYVAITRPKKKLFILTETTKDEDESDFLALLKT